MKKLIDELALELAVHAELEPNDNKYYSDSKKKAEQARSRIEDIITDIVSPNLTKWIPLRLKQSKIAEFVSSYVDNRRKLDAALGDYTDAVECMKFFAIDHAFEQGLKAGLRLQSELKNWAEK